MKKEIEFGLFATPLSKQLKGTGITTTDLKQFDNDNNAIDRLLVRRLLTAKQVDAARKKLLKRIGDYLSYVKKKI